MNKQQIFDAIASAFSSLSETNQMLYDYWLSELYDEDGNLLDEEWNEDNLRIMENDVMHQKLMDSYVMENDYNDDY